MRESVGAAWIFSICITFILLFTAYLAVSVNYAKAFKLKSHIVSMIEENEGYNPSLNQTIKTYLTSEGYMAYGTCRDLKNDGWEFVDSVFGPTGYDAVGRDSGVCIYSQTIPPAHTNTDIANCQTYYKVVTFFKFDIPMLSYITTFRVSGETRKIYEFAGKCDLNG